MNLSVLLLLVQFPFITPDSQFKTVEPPDWVLDGAV